jgi:probable F420-dependent oxidoreductase
MARVRAPSRGPIVVRGGLPVPDAAPTHRFGYSGSPFGTTAEAIDTAVRAEAAGFDTFLLPDLPGALSPLVTLAAVARETRRIGLGTFVLNTGLWNPATVGRELATLDRVSGGRVEITLGSGIPRPATAAVMPPTRQARFERLESTVEALERTFAEPGMTPGFERRPRLLVAGTGDRTLRLAAERADGFIIAFVPPVAKVQLPPGQMVLPELEATERFLERLRGYAGDRADRLEVGTGSAVVLTDDAAAAAAEMAEVHTYLTPAQILAAPKILIGTADEVAAQVLDRGRRLGLTYQVLRGATPEDLAPVLATVRAG